MWQAHLMRVVGVGTSCSGKTTFARSLAACLGTRCIELDSLYCGYEWTPRSDFENEVRVDVHESSWVIEGN